MKIGSFFFKTSHHRADNVNKASRIWAANQVFFQWRPKVGTESVLFHKNSNILHLILSCILLHKAILAPSFGHYWKQLIGNPLSMSPYSHINLPFLFIDHKNAFERSFVLDLPLYRLRSLNSTFRHIKRDVYTTCQSSRCEPYQNFSCKFRTWILKTLENSLLWIYLIIKILTAQ